MKNYTETELASINESILDNNRLIDESIGWANKYLKYDDQLDLLLTLKNSKKVLTKIGENLSNKPVIALFGASQVGKSYLIKNLLSVEGKPFVIKNGKEDYDFLKDINPAGVGAESTGVVTRFTKNSNVSFEDFPIEVKLLTPKDILLIICDAYFLDAKKIVEYPSNNDFEDLLIKLENASSGSNQNILTEFDLLDCKEYFELHFSKYTLLFDGLSKTRFFERIGKIICNYSYSDWAEIFSIIWNKNAVLTDLFKELIGHLQTLGFDKKVFLNFNSVLRGHSEILDVQRLKELNKSDNFINVKRKSAEVVSVNLAYTSALIAELIFQIPDEILVEKEFMINSDLLDFPGARSRLAVEISDITQEMKPDLLLRGKVSYLFNKYSDDFNINNLLFCTNDKQLDVNELPSLLHNWIEKNVGQNEHDRSVTLTENEIDPLFVVFTFFNNQLKYDSTNDHDFSDFSKLNYKWENRFNRFFQNEIVTTSKNWHKKWTKDKPLFSNFYLLRDFKYSSDTFSGFEDTGKENAIALGREGYYSALKSSFLDFDFVKNHFINPVFAWESAAQVQNDGTKLIISNLNKVSNNYSKIRNYLGKIQIEMDRVKTQLKKHAHIDDLTELRLQAIRKSSDFQFTLNSSFSKDKTNFIKLLKCFYVEPVHIYNLINENIVSNMASKNSEISVESKLLLTQFPGLREAQGHEEVLSILMKNLFLQSTDEVETFLAEKGISVDQLSGNENEVSLSTVLVDLVFSKWEEQWKSEFSKINVGLKESHYEFLANHYKKLFVSKGYKTKMNIIFSSVLNELESNRGSEEFLSETASLILNDLVNNFDTHTLTKEAITEIELISKTYNIDCSFLNQERKTINEERLAFFFGDNSGSVADLSIEKCSLWINRFKVSVLAGCGFVEYDEAANNELMTILSRKIISLN